MVNAIIIALIVISSISIILLLREWSKEIPQADQKRINYFIAIHNYIRSIGLLFIFLTITGFILGMSGIQISPNYGAFARVINFAAQSSLLNKTLLALLGVIMVWAASKFKHKIKSKDI